MKLQYQAEEALQVAVRRIQAIADPTLTDPLFGYRGAYAYGDTEHTIDWLVNTATFPTPETAETPNPACPEPFDPETGLDDTGSSGSTSNVICNFLGDSSPDTQVILVRKSNQVESGLNFAVYLVNVIARDGVGRKRAIQGAVILPFEITVSAPTTIYGLPADEHAYLATVTTATGD